MLLLLQKALYLDDNGGAMSKKELKQKRENN